MCARMAWAISVCNIGNCVLAWLRLVAFEAIAWAFHPTRALQYVKRPVVAAH